MNCCDQMVQVFNELYCSLSEFSCSSSPWVWGTYVISCLGQYPSFVAAPNIFSYKLKSSKFWSTRCFFRVNMKADSPFTSKLVSKLDGVKLGWGSTVLSVATMRRLFVDKFLIMILLKRTPWMAWSKGLSPSFSVGSSSSLDTSLLSMLMFK